ncbi:MAG: hypothetical protein LKF80_12490 [Brevundimonas sp.]|jgi:hypothetical protein|uniref:hypothetical protein n=1 Tax=Brevundimonas sp. TaxID=1871086 RepID=UPI0025BCDE0E|nr:hypothetical protein [Brevundimonas sp.]MCH4269214.1 hypothetical protein [Brevundimonas sp.]
MSEFDALFAFYALLLGLAVANVATAFAEMYKVRGRVVIGWTVPLLGAVVLTAACQQWLSLFRAQADMKLGPGELLICLAMALPYIFISQVIRPRHDETASLEAYYAEHRRILAGALLVPVLASSVVNVIYAVALNDGFVPAALGFLIYQGVRYACIIPMLIWPNVAVQRAGLVVLLAHTVLMMF